MVTLSSSRAAEKPIGDFDEPEIRGCYANQEDEEQRQWRHEIQPLAHWEKRKDSRDGNRPKRHGDQERVRLAPVRSPPRSDSEDHEHLGSNRPYEPAGLKQRLTCSKQM
jgi:hypothetical protein